MVNIDDFVKRLEVLLEYYGLNASAFADKISVQRSSMSHLLSGRNKPSLDFVLKISDIFPDVDLYWILKGTGSFPKKENEHQNHTVEIVSEVQKTSPPVSPNENLYFADLFSGLPSDTDHKEEKRVVNEPKNSNSDLKTTDEIEKIIFFYKNGTFKTYIP
ncbi:helix-turn-helix transcriptional regulator [Flavobacterium poyangense]|uniref:helix-turn-helix transcriptional regulator n=1 Tax=Flavobacterium poyangense TaxID=2204302 RepID=UPI00142305B6|nr:helix-turn-helix transcriptional regulator [Flavobacterium sp. JXAS1]